MYNFPCALNESYAAQVTVVGGGPAGVCAAIAAARNGAKTLLIESGNCLGGMATLGQVNPFMTCYDKDGDNMIIHGLFKEIVDRLVARGAAIDPAQVPAGSAFTSYIVVGHNHVTPFDAETLKVVLDEMCCEAGVQVLFHSTFVSPVMEENRLTGLVIMTKGGLKLVKSDIVIDCTGDADEAQVRKALEVIGLEAGTPISRVIGKNILPFMTSVIVTVLATELPSYISMEVFLSYIGIGLSAEVPSLGRMISEAQSAFLTYPWEFWPPVAIASAITIILYVLGQNLADASDPRTHM